MPTIVAIIFSGALLLAGLLIGGIYAIEPSASSQVVYKVNRLTGTLWFCLYEEGCEKVINKNEGF